MNPDWPTLVEKVKNGIEMPDTLAVGLLMPGLYRSAVAFARDIAIIRIARTALAIERYRLANGDLPTSLADCVPAYLDSVPEDPFDGLPIRYRPTEDGYILYSVFDDLDDDDGAEWKRDREWVRSGDYPFEVRTAPSSLSP